MSSESSARIIEKRIRQGGIDIAFPQVIGLPDKKVQEAINREIKELVNNMLAKQREWPDAYGMKILEMIGTYDIKLNENGILSVYFENYMLPEHAANASYLAKSITVDLNTGQVYTLSDLFNPDTNYLTALNKIISKQFKEQYPHMLKEFEGININQDYYLTPKNLVIYFQMYEYTSRPYGIPKFEIPYWRIIKYINKEGPIGRLLSFRTGNSLT